MNQNHKDKLMPDAFIKKDSAERYNPKKDELPYSKPALEKLKKETGWRN